MPCRVPKRRFSCGTPQHLTKNLFLLAAAMAALLSSFDFESEQASCRWRAVLCCKVTPLRKKEPNMRHQTALREGTELIFQSHGPAAESLLQRLAICGFGPLKNDPR